MKKERTSNLLYLLAFITSVIYLGWRILYTIPWQDSTFSWVFGLLLWISEVISSFTAFILIFNKRKQFKLVKPEIPEDAEWPHVDVLIATHNEEVDIVYKTLNACTKMYYPEPEKVHIYISDDTNRPEMKALAEQFGVGYCGLENNKHAKSGNLNNALAQTNSPLVATFDADMIPYHQFLMETVPYFMGEQPDPDRPIGLIQTPQSFYNADIFQYHFFSEARLPNEQDFFSKSVNVLNNARGAAVYTGSNTLIRRQAIEDAGGFPINTITEDFELGVRMNIAGYKNYSTNDPMASGLTPTDLRSVIKQRVRWGRGVIRSSYNTNIFFNPHLTAGQKMVYINGFFYWSSFFRRLLYIIAPILYTVFHRRIVIANVWLLLIFWLPSYVLTRRSMEDVTDTYRTQTWGEIVETMFAPYLVIPLTLEMFGISETKFKVTSKELKKSNIDIMFALPYIILWGLSVYGLITFNLGKFGVELFYGSVISFWLLHHIINLTFAIFATLGRPILRNQERFYIEEPARVKVKDQWHEVIVVDVSEGGFSFRTDQPLYFKDKVTIDFIEHAVPCQVEGELVRVQSQPDSWLYGIKIKELDEETRRNYFQYIYDRPNTYLTDVRDTWVTIWDDLLENFIQRIHFRKNRITQSLYRTPTTPKVAGAMKTELAKVPVTITMFDFEKMVVHFQKEKPSPTEFIFNNGQVKLRLKELAVDRIDKEITYQVVEFDEPIDKGLQLFCQQIIEGRA